MSQDPLQPIAYQKRCRRLGVTRAATLYEAEDHYLLVEGWVWQSCRRFYFDKIQAITVRPTRRTLLELLVLGSPLVLLGIIAFLLPGADLGDRIGLAVLASPFAALFLFCLVRFLIAGASQDVFFTTAVQTSPILPLEHRRWARRHLEAIHEQVEAAQRDLAPATPSAPGPPLAEDLPVSPPDIPSEGPPPLPPGP